MTVTPSETLPAGLRAPPVFADIAEAPRARHRLFTALDTVAYIAIGTALCGELLAVLANVTGRAFFHYSLLWTDEIGQIVLSILAFVGGAIAYRHDQQSAVHTVVDAMPPRWSAACRAGADWLVMLIAAVTGYLSIRLLTGQIGETTPILDLPAWVLVAPMSAGMALLIVYAAERLYRQQRAATLWTGLVLVAVVALIVATRGAWVGVFTGAIPIVVALLAFLAAVILGLPVGFALLLATLIDLYPSPSIPLIAIPQTLNDGMGFVLLALPFFIFAGAIMENGGISVRLVEFARTLVGHLKGGLLQVTIVSIYLVSGLSGSKAADVAAVGPIMRTMLQREKIPLEEGAAVLAASAAMGETIPPSLGLLVLGSITTLSMGKLFTAGIIPAAVIAACLMLLVFFRAGRTNMPRS
ncbi:MAG TPA: TRAP transporter large permease subunit, partial [Stellaceae bacterium]|nr:TRAP transporter large permease subunit [Stellaceae bacterium]